MLKNPDLGLLIIRIVVAIAFIYHGVAKFQSMETFTGFFAMIGLTASFWVPLVAFFEVLVGAMVLLGVCARYAGVVGSIIMLVAISLVHFKNGYDASKMGYEYQLLLLACFLGMIFLGSGKYSLMKEKGEIGE